MTIVIEQAHPERLLNANIVTCKIIRVTEHIINFLLPTGRPVFEVHYLRAVFHLIIINVVPNREVYIQTRGYTLRELCEVTIVLRVED